MRKYQVPRYLHAALATLRPPENLRVSEWAEKYRVLDERSSNIAGPWRNAITPYLVGIMDEFNNPDTEEIIFCKPTQVGGTEAANNIVGYIIGQNPGPTMIVYPSDKLGKSVVKNRIVPMVLRSPQLRERYRKRESSVLELQFEGMYLNVTGAESPSSLSSKPIGYLILDEVDKYPLASGREASPIALAKERTKTYAGRKIFITSTPTARTGNIWSAMESADVIKHYFVPCPHCGEMIEFVFSQLKWPDDEGMSYADRAEFAYYVCQECGGVITDRDKTMMLRGGEWRNVRQSATVHRTVAFWLNTLYSPFTRFAEIAKAFLLSKADPELLQNFVNSWLAEPWEDARLRTSADLVLDRKTEVPEGIVPDWAELLTAGVDVQQTSLYYTIRAWGRYLTSQVIKYEQVAGFEDIEYAMNLEYRKANGERFLVNLALIDSGDQTEAVYEFCQRNSEWAMPTKGSSSPLGPHYFRESVVHKPTIKLITVDGGKYKDAIAARLQRENGQGSFMAHAGTDEEYAQQLTAEQKISIRKNGREVTRWELKASHGANHYLDAEVYAFAAADVLGVRNLHLQEAPQDDDTITTTEPKKGGWLKGGSANE